jgi:hypothetical protein
MRVRFGRMLTLGLALILAGCGDDDSFSPTVENVSGTYAPATFTVTSATGTVDLLALGAEVSLTLDPDGTTTGELFVPGGGEGGEDFEADLAGTWTLEGSTVTFNQTTDTFIGEVEFTAERDRLTAEDTGSGQTVRLVLEKTD